MLYYQQLSKFPRASLQCSVLTVKRQISLVVASKAIALGFTAAALGYLGLESYWRSRTLQEDRIRAKLEQPLDIDVPRSLFLKHARSVERRFLQIYFEGAPSGPVFIVGPRGTGKSELMKEVMRSRRMALFMDLHKNPVSSGEEFFFWLVDSTGYWVPRYSEMARFLLREPPRKSRITHEELEKALEVLDQVLEKEKQKGWPQGVPIICIDDMFKLITAVCGRQLVGQVADFRALALSDPYFNKFVDWCEHLTNNKLAHLVFVTSTSHLGEIDAIDSFRQNRSLVWVNHTSPEGIRNYLKEDFQRYSNKSILTEKHVEWIEKCIGGHVDDLDQVTIAIKRGESFNTVLRRMISESITLLETRLELILREASKINVPEDKARVLEKYLRFWRLMEVLRDHRYVSRRDIINIIFKENIAELDDYVTLDIVSYLSRGGGSRPSEPEMVEGVVDSDVVATEQQPHQDRKKDIDLYFETESYMLLTEGLGGVIVTASSSRVRIAFDSILKHPRMLKQRRRVEDHLRLKHLNDERNTLINAKSDLNKERQIYTEELTQLVLNSEKWKSEMGPEVVEKRKFRVISQEGEVEAKLKAIQEKILRIEEDIQWFTKKARREGL